MKKIFFFAALFLGLGMAARTEAAVDYRTTRGPWGRAGIVMGRGLANVVGLPFEIPRTIALETERHSRLWPVTMIPRAFTNVAGRACSAMNDVLFSPWIVPFTDDLSPWTKSFGLSDYPWNKD